MLTTMLNRPSHPTQAMYWNLGRAAKRAAMMAATTTQTTVQVPVFEKVFNPMEVAKNLT